MPSLIKLNEFFKSRLYKFIVAFVVAINGYLVFALGSDEQKIALKTNLGKLGSLIVDWSGAVIFLSIFFGGIISIFIAYLQEKIDKQNVVDRFAVVLLETIETVVEEKRKRFAKAVEELLQEGQSQPTASTVFKNITQPEEQIKNIIKALEVCYKTLYPNVYFKIALMEVENNTLKKWAYFLPYTARPNTCIDELRSSESAISQALITKNIVVVDDVQKELVKTENKKYIKGSTKLNENWSQLCYPIKSITSNEVIFIVCIAAKEANFFQSNQEFLGSYEWLLNFFSSRLALEHSLAELKGKAR
ncbi:hypothetical protein [Acinetobacter sp. YH12069]|uniref:hypothetical protein n=1 Tax=Acinetobacter sp. YH12069 TaxID=2601065 RepID=UPI0015D22AF8|nr:hypothetical protein [Acinetobacter sp. YH12069]